jgi:hypothetical protein
LFQDRFKSEVVENDKYFVTVLRYIHQNPIKAGLCDSVEKYRWSGHNDYISKAGIVDYKFALGIIGAVNFTKYMAEKNNDKCLEYIAKSRLTDQELIKEIEKQFKIKVNMIQNEPKEKMESIFKKALEIEGATARQLSRVAGVSANIIWRL